MTAIELLKRHGPMPADHIAAWLGVESTQAYADLVRLYDASQVRINCGHGGADARTWEAMDEATT